MEILDTKTETHKKHKHDDEDGVDDDYRLVISELDNHDDDEDGEDDDYWLVISERACRRCGG